jgi:hypothetical protein
MITVKLKGENNVAEVDDEGRVHVTASGIPPKEPASEIRIFRQYLTVDGTEGGSFDMQVVGTATNPIDFYIKAATDADRYIDSINIVIADQNAALNEFGNITALTNGVEIYYEDPILGRVAIHEALKSNFDFVRLCGKGSPAIGSGATSFRASNVQGASEGYIVTLDFSDQFGVPYGIRIPKDSTLKIVMCIKDDTTGVDAFNAIAYGYDRII